MFNRRVLLAGVVAATLAIAPVQAFAAGWVTLGSRTVSLFLDHDTIHVGLFSGVFSKIQLTVKGDAVFMKDLHITYVSGAGQDIPVRFLFLAGTHSRVIDLPGIARLIRRVDMTYAKLPFGGKALVTVSGYKL